MKILLLPILTSLILLMGGMTAPFAGDARTGPIVRGHYLAQPGVQAFIDRMVDQHRFERAQLETLFAQAERQERVLELIAAPAEGLPWYEYRDIFLTGQRIEGGVAFWAEHEETLARAEAVYGVPARIITAIIGVETYYGRQTGGFPVLDTLITLGFDYAPRADFFRSELEEFLILSREESLDRLDMEGSYAGAMGKGQFIASSYRSFAVDFDDDGSRDLLNSTADAIGSVANYLNAHGWRAGAPIAFPAEVRGSDYRELLEKGLKPAIRPAALEGHGVTAPQGELDDAEVALLEFEQPQGEEYWLGLKNFYVITRYNHSPLYAMVVYQLSEAIAERRRAEARGDAGTAS